MNDFFCEQVTLTIVGDEMVQTIVRENNQHDKITFKVEGDYVVGVRVFIINSQ